jgi:hypothetical protein
MTSTKRQRRPISADIEFIASLEADELRFDEPPETAVRFFGEPGHESTSRSDRTNLPEKLNPACRIGTSGRLHGSPAASLGRPSRVRHREGNCGAGKRDGSCAAGRSRMPRGSRPATASRSRCLAELFGPARSGHSSGNSPSRSESPGSDLPGRSSKASASSRGCWNRDAAGRSSQRAADRGTAARLGGSALRLAIGWAVTRSVAGDSIAIGFEDEVVISDHGDRLGTVLRPAPAATFAVVVGGVEI